MPAVQATCDRIRRDLAAHDAAARRDDWPLAGLAARQFVLGVGHLLALWEPRVLELSLEAQGDEDGGVTLLLDVAAATRRLDVEVDALALSVRVGRTWRDGAEVSTCRDWVELEAALRDGLEWLLNSRVA